MYAEIVWMKCHDVFNLLLSTSAKIKGNLLIKREAHMARG